MSPVSRMSVVGQDFGEIWTGQATDPNTCPHLILLAAAYWPLTGSEPAAPMTPSRCLRSC